MPVPVETVVRAVGWLALAIVAGSIAFNTLAYVGAALHRRRHPSACAFAADDEAPWPARMLAALRAFAVECAVTALLAVTFPFSLRRQRIQPFDDRVHRRPVVFLHGYAQHSANFLWLARRLRRDGWLHLYSVRHTAAWGDIERSGQRLGEALDRILRESGATSLDIVAHSMGGLVARACLRARGRSGVARLITLGTPHQGTEAFRWLGREPMIAQMRVGSALVRGLGADDPVPSLVECTAIYSLDDALVVPGSHGYYPGAFNVEVRGLGHASLLFSRRVYGLVRENLAAGSAGVPATGAEPAGARG